MAENKNHWYDGLFYDKLIAPNQDAIFSEIKHLIEPNSKVIDIGCGTGRFSFKAADKCNSILGIDLSRRNIEMANTSLRKNPIPNIQFQHKSTAEILLSAKEKYDYAVLTYVIHEVDESERTELLNSILQIANKIIIGDYHSDQSNKFWKVLNEVVEILAGKKHYKNYKNFIETGGLINLAKGAGLKIIFEIKDRPLTSHLVVLQSK